MEQFRRNRDIRDEFLGEIGGAAEIGPKRIDKGLRRSSIYLKDLSAQKVRLLACRGDHKQAVGKPAKPDGNRIEAVAADEADHAGVPIVGERDRFCSRDRQTGAVEITSPLFDHFEGIGKRDLGGRREAAVDLDQAPQMGKVLPVALQLQGRGRKVASGIALQRRIENSRKRRDQQEKQGSKRDRCNPNAAPPPKPVAPRRRTFLADLCLVSHRLRPPTAPLFKARSIPTFSAPARAGDIPSASRPSPVRARSNDGGRTIGKTRRRNGSTTIPCSPPGKIRRPVRSRIRRGAGSKRRVRSVAIPRETLPMFPGDRRASGPDTSTCCRDTRRHAHR